MPVCGSRPRPGTTRNARPSRILSPRCDGRSGAIRVCSHPGTHPSQQNSSPRSAMASSTRSVTPPEWPNSSLAAVRIDGYGDNLCSSLEELGYEFAPADLLADGPSSEGAKVFAVELESGSPRDSSAERS